MLAHLMKAIAQLGDPALRRVLLVGTMGSLVLFAALSAGLWSLVLQFDFTELWGVGWLIEWMGDWFDWVAGFLLGGVLLTVTLLLFPGVATIIFGIFLEDVVAAVEARHYPNLPEPRPQPLAEVMWITVKFALIVVAVNILALPLYAILFFLPPLNLVVFYLINGSLVGREYYELVALRRLDPTATEAMRRRNRGRLLVAGIVLTFLLTVPVVNFLVPILGAAFMVHVVQKMLGGREITV
jgi:uncharacterized protein involved in cysteine biosynthesis